MEQIIVTTKLKTEQSFNVVFYLVVICFLAVFTLAIHDWQSSNFLFFPLIAFSLFFRMIFDLPKQNIKAVVLDRQGIIIQRHLLRDIYLPYDKLTYVWNYTFHFLGFDLDTNLFQNQHEIIGVINHFRAQGLIIAPERKPIFREFVSEWAFLFVLIPIFSAMVIGLGFELFTATQWLARAMMFGAMIFSAAAFLVRTIYRYWLRVSKCKPA